MKKPMKKLWSGRFKEKTAKSVESFTESISFDRRLYKYDIAGSIAHANMLGRQGIIPKADAKKIISGLKEILKEIESGRFRFKPGLEDIHMNIEAALIEKIGPSGGRLHTARSRNDQIALDIRLYLREKTNGIISLLKRLETTMLNTAERNMDAIMPGYTHMQRAQPVFLSHHLLSYLWMFERDRQRLADSLKRINILPLGSCALAGTTLPIDREYAAALLGFDKVSENSIDAVSDRDFIIEFIAAASILMMHLSRLSGELVLWSTTEFSFIELPDAYSTGSSIMPQKKNPDVAELIRGKTGRVYGSLFNILTVMKGLPLSYNRDFQEDKPPLFDTVDTVEACLTVLNEMFPEIKFNKERMLDAAYRGFSTATDMAEYLVKRGIPFRDAHEIIGRIVLYAIENRKELGGLGLDELRRFSRHFAKDVFEAIKVDVSVKGKKSEGGTSPESVKKQIKELKSLLREP
jgi:argininosuccinate lyase